MKMKVLAWLFCVFFLGYASSSGFINSVLDGGYEGLAGNSVVDIVYDGEYIWIGTGNGLSKFDDSSTWISYDKSSGLNEDGVSALAYLDSTLWVALSYEVFRTDRLYPFGANFNTTEDHGDTWDTVTTDSSQARGLGKLCYDMAGMNGTVWAACWYGGLIRSKDSGKTWENIFPNLASEQDWTLFEPLNCSSYRLDNKFFAVAVDTSPIQSYLDKNFITKINGEVISDSLILLVGTKNGLHYSFGASGILDPVLDEVSVSSVNIGSLLMWAGMYYQEDGKIMGTGIRKSSDGYDWTLYTPEQATSENKVALDITSIGDSLVWAACFYGGLIESRDSGSTWENIFVDSLAEYNYQNEIEDLRNSVYSVTVDTISSDSLILWSGTEAGIFKFIYTASGSTVVNYDYAGAGISGDSVFSLAIQRYDDKKVIWAGAGPKGGVGDFGVSKSEDGGENWDTVLSGIEVRDFAFQDSIVWVVTNKGLRRSFDYGENWGDTISIVDTLGYLSYFRAEAHKLKSYDLNSVFVSDSIIWVGGRDGLARSINPDSTWTIYNFSVSYDEAVWTGSAAGIFKFIYNNSDSADTAIQYTTSNNLTGNFVTSLAIQKYDDKKVIWAATNPTSSGQAYGISKSEDEGVTWDKCLEGTRTWNFAFSDSIVWAATDDGLQRSRDYGESWDIFNYMKDVDDTLTENKIFSTVFYSVCAVKEDDSWTIWGGNVDGLVKSVNVDDNEWNVYRSFVPIGTPGSETAYAYPSPFSPIVSSGARVRIHHKPKEDSYVTIKIYDFAMNLVAALVDREFRLGGRDYDEPWDGKNDRGDVVANGVYFFKVETSKGQKEWGKLVILK